MPPVTRSHTMHQQTHKLFTIAIAFGALVVLMRTQGKALRNDWSPVGIGVKVVLLLCVASLIYYPYELFLKGPAAVNEAMRM